MCHALLRFVLCRAPHGLPLVLYLLRVESWALSRVHLEEDQAGEPSAPPPAAAERQMQQPAAAMPFR